MIRIDSKNVADSFYDEIKNLILSKDEKQYEKHQHHLYEEKTYPGISKDYYNENGSLEFKNIKGEIIRLEINRFHRHSHNGFSGLCGNPCLSAKIYRLDVDQKQLLWELNVEAGTLVYHAEATSLEIPRDSLEEEKLIEPNIEETTLFRAEVAKIKKENIFAEIARAYNNSEKLTDSKDKLETERDNKIKKVTKVINKEYATKFNQINKEIATLKKETEKFNKLLKKYSMFNIDIIGKILEKLMSIVEGEEYNYRQVIHKFNIRRHGVMDSWDEEVKKIAFVIAPKNYLDNNYQIDFENNNFLFLFEDEIYSLDLKIPIFAIDDGQISCVINTDKFGYIKNFLEHVVQYRFENNIENITEEQMLDLLSIFISSYEEKIIDTYCARVRKKITNLIQKEHQ